MIALIAASALASSQETHGECCWVVGASVVVALGEGAGSRVGGGIDVGHQTQVYTQRAERIGGNYAVWAEEHPAPNYGPVAHLWRVRGAWTASVGARVGLEWPLRAGIWKGWWPGPAVTVELAPALSTDGWVGLDGQVAVDAPWIQGRLGTALSDHGWKAARVAIAPFYVVGQPRNWTDVPSWWEEPAPGDPVPPTTNER